jgi:hypothetical protein
MTEQGFRVFLSSHAKLRSTSRRSGMTLKVCRSWHTAICTAKHISVGVCLEWVPTSAQADDVGTALGLELATHLL